jgi:hypothetical protein
MGLQNVFSDNISTVISATIPTSLLKKTHNVLAYLRVREAIVAGIIRVAEVKSEENLSDTFTKPLPGHKLRYLINVILW